MGAQNIEGNPEEKKQSVTGSAVVLEETKETEMLGWVQTEARGWQKMVHSPVSSEAIPKHQSPARRIFTMWLAQFSEKKLGRWA